MKQLKVYRVASGLLGQNHQALLLAEDSGSEGIRAEDLIFSGFNPIRIQKFLQELQWPGFAFPANGEILEQRGYSFRG